jgi:thiamine pyrophosphokinase
MATLLCLPGKWPDISYLPNFDFVIGVDSGADVALNHGIKPDLIVGDLDSIIKENHPNKIILEESGQDDNDLSKALRICVERELNSICIVGFTGKRNDHELGNYAAIHNANHQLEIKILLEDMIVHRIVSGNEFHALAPVGTLVSIFSFEETDVYTTGLKWNISGKLGFSSKGLSNHTINSTFTVSTNGCICVMIHNS